MLLKNQRQNGSSETCRRSRIAIYKNCKVDIFFVEIEDDYDDFAIKIYKSYSRPHHYARA